MKTSHMIIAAVVVLAAVVIGYTMQSGGMSDAVRQPIVLDPQPDAATLVEMARGVEIGNSDAPITIMEFGDFQCPACRDFRALTKPQVDLTYVESGQAKFVFYDYPLVDIHPNAFLAARAARCAEDQGQFWAYHDLLFTNQNLWAFQPDPAGHFVDYAEELQVDMAAFRSCLNSDMHAELVTANRALAQALGLPGTPGILIRVEGVEGAVRPADASFISIQAVVENALANLAVEADTAGVAESNE